MEPSELLVLLSEKLEFLQLPYFVTVSMATIIYGEPRYTNDIDAVISLKAEDVRVLNQCFPAPEDVILKKMSFYQHGRSEKHIRDIVGVLAIQQDRIDQKYIDDWAAKLNLTDIWHTVQNDFHKLH